MPHSPPSVPIEMLSTGDAVEVICDLNGYERLLSRAWGRGGGLRLRSSMLPGEADGELSR